MVSTHSSQQDATENSLVQRTLGDEAIGLGSVLRNGSNRLVVGVRHIERGLLGWVDLL